MIWGLDEVLTEFLHELCKRLLEGCKHTEAQRDLFRQPSDSALPADTPTSLQPAPEGSDSSPGEGKRAGPPSAVGAGGDVRAACPEVLRGSARWSCILEITAPRGSLGIGAGSETPQTHTDAL